ncbi:SRPBCC family protein [Aquicoccus sp. G2-2]|uniref:SRPBCC family protein n=1 Tax=Aquicoccus sp. G2-2 TaxID=3092120 RepID=UPI002AE02F85|nr:SRPBCC family protein [Aquicoccus sp. G2-2]MEA1114922.1 SRPBCC family protein [Aquicoccus sp. G2-2]
MKFKTREDIAAPIDYVFGAISDFEGFERQALRRGAEVARLDELEEPGEGMGWHIAFPFRGKRREMDVELVDYSPSTRMLLDSRMPGMNGEMSVELMALSKGRTRLELVIEFRPETLAARLLVQSIKLARSSLNKRLQLRVADFAKNTEDRYTRMA